MTHDTKHHNDDASLQIQQRQYQKQRQQQREQKQQHPYATPSKELPEKQHQSKHNPISETSQFASHNWDQ